jgi:hypothetical protein
METLLHQIRAGNKKGTLEYLHAFFMGMAEINVVDRKLAEAVVVALDRNFVELTRELEDISLDGDEMITGDQLLATQPLQGLAALAQDGDDDEGGSDEESE